MFKLLLTAMLAATAGGSVAQPTFMKVFYGAGTAQFNINEMSSGNLRIGMGFQSGTSLMRPSGEIVQSHHYDIDTMLALQSVQKYSDSVFYFTASYYKNICTETGNTRMYPVIGRMDSMGVITAARHYDLAAPQCTNGGGDIQPISTGGAIAWGKRDRFYALRVDASLTPIWAKRFSNRGSFQFIKELPGGDLLAGINMDTAAAVVARLDAAGNFIWCKSYMRPSGMVHDALVESDDSFIITGVTDSTSANPFFPLPPTFQPKLFMMKLNGNGDVQWCRGYDSAPGFWYTMNSSRIVQAQDGRYVVAATLGYPGINWINRPLLMKTDQNGDTVWTRSMGVDGYVYQTVDLLAYSDGGFVYNGLVWGELPEGQTNIAFIHKTDAEGHLPCSERHHPIEVIDLFPVDSNLILTSVDGAIEKPAFFQEMVYPPITVYEACEIIATGLQAKPSRSRRPSVRPNPSSGRFTVQFQDPLIADSYYSLFDTMGKLLLQRPLPTGATLEEVDLTRFGAGSYVIKFTSPEGVCYERVVVE